MDDENGDKEGENGNPELTPRPPDDDDLIALCRRFNDLDARYVVVGGFAMIHLGYGRFTEDLDFLIDVSPENESRIFQALESLPDQAVKELDPGDVAKYLVVRVADEVVVDLMKSACGIDYHEAICDAVFREINGVRIPFASPALLWRMKAPTHREKDQPDLLFLRKLFEDAGEEPPPVSDGRSPTP